MNNTYEIITLKGFDSDGDPEIRKFTDGSLSIVFNFMPPLNGTDDEIEDPIFDDFNEELEKFLGVEVLWDDREVFIIKKPNPDTINKLKVYLENFWIERK